jgi:hypothetical protein
MRRFALMVVIIATLSASTAGADCSVTISEAPSVLGGRRLRATVTHDGGRSRAELAIYTANDQYYTGGQRTCAGTGPCIFEAEYSCLPPNAVTIKAFGAEWKEIAPGAFEPENRGRRCSTQSALPAAGDPSLTLTGAWEGSNFAMTASYTTVAGNGIGSLTLQYENGDGNFIDWIALPPLRLGQGTMPLSAGVVAGAKLRLKWVSDCGTARSDLNRYSNVLEIPEPEAQYFVQAYAATDDLPTIELKRTSELQKIVIPLGGELRVGLQRGPFTGEALTAQFTLTDQHVQQPLGRRFLFGNSVAVLYGPDGPVQEKALQAVHYGTARLRIAPSDGSAPTVDVVVEVVPPAHLGSTQNTWFADDDMLDVAHKTGLPPQTVKGQRKQEGPFTADGGLRSLVYEPCRDVDTIQSRIDEEPYSLFTAPEPRGEQLEADDLDGRAKYSIFAPNAAGQSERRPIQPADIDVTIAQIFEANDCVYRDAQGRCHGANWSYTCNAGVLRRVKEATGTDAQTPASSSYGWFQVMYYTAIADGWYVEHPAGTRRRNPHLLYDTPKNLAIGGGTLYFGNYLNVKHWRSLFPDENETTALTSWDDFATRLRRMYIMYNRHWKTPANSNGPHFSDYGQAVLYYSREFLPLRSGSILQ